MWQKVIKVLNLGNSSRGIKLCLFVVGETIYLKPLMWALSWKREWEKHEEHPREPLQWALDILFAAKTAERQTGSVLTLPFLKSDAAAKQLLLNKRFLNMYRVSSTNLENKLKATMLWKSISPSSCFFFYISATTTRCDGMMFFL